MKYKVIIFDSDGMVNNGQHFTDRYTADFGIDVKLMMPFIKNDFLDCELGRKDLKTEIVKYFEDWKWQGNVEELLNYWFEGEVNIDEKMFDEIEKLKKSEVKCYLATNQEKYRLEFMKEKMGYKDLFYKIYASCDVGFMKKENEFLEYVYGDISKDCNVQKDEVLFWDDKPDHIDKIDKFGFVGKVYKNFDDFKKVISK
ncbi:hypothetical protein KJ641_02640 [Patescibacteria group bacterium]|nr:hypothetical protein [Patescibacteria group bacterium]MBU1895742.1 hypothetical protein [Patescibacteria group bacterium]